MTDLIKIFIERQNNLTHTDESGEDSWIDEEELNNSSTINEIIENYIKNNKLTFPKNIDKIMSLGQYDTTIIYCSLINHGYKFTNNLILLLFFNDLYWKNLDKLEPECIKNNSNIKVLVKLLDHIEVKKYLDNEVIITDKDIDNTIKLKLSNDFNKPEDFIDTIVLFKNKTQNSKIKWPKPVFKLNKYIELYNEILFFYSKK